MTALDFGLYELAKLFLLPVLGLIVLSLVYAMVVLGAFLMEGAQRTTGRYCSRLRAYQAESGATSDDMELWILRQLEWLRIVSRGAPMLGLVATMIPMGPALLALSNNDAKAVGGNLVVAFSAVIIALISATVTFTVLTVRRRWLLEELRTIERERELR